LAQLIALVLRTAIARGDVGKHDKKLAIARRRRDRCKESAVGAAI